MTHQELIALIVNAISSAIAGVGGQVLEYSIDGKLQRPADTVQVAAPDPDVAQQVHDALENVPLVQG